MQMDGSAGVEALIRAGRPGGLDLWMELAAWQVGDDADPTPTPPTTGRPVPRSIVVSPKTYAARVSNGA